MGALALRLVSASSGARLQAALPVVSIAVATVLLLLTAGAAHGFDARAQRSAWRSPEAAARPTAIQAVRIDHLGDAPITVVELAALGEGAPVPPGMDRVPAPGELWVSPELARRMEQVPADQLAGRFDAAPSGTLDAATLAHPGELLAVVGSAPDAPGMTADPLLAPWVADGRHPPTRIAAWSSTPGETAEMYLLLAAIGVALMAVPLLSLGAAAARLVAARRNRRLSLLRLIGGSVGQVVGLTAAESAVLGAAGALLGGIAYLLALPLAARLEIGGGAWFVADIWIGPLLFVGVLAAIVGLVVLSGVITLLPSARRPFTTARSQRPHAARAWRPVAFVAALVVFWNAGGAGLRGVAVPLALVLGAFTLLGPWVMGIFGRIIARTARGVPGMLAGRRLVDDPRAGWRAVAGMVLAAFVAGYMAVAVPSDIDEELLGSPGTLRLAAPAARAEDVAGRARERLAVADVTAGVEVGDPPFWAPADSRSVWIDVGGGPAEVERARTALAGVVPGMPAATAIDDHRTDLTIFDDVRIGAIVVLLSAFLVAAVSAGVGGISRVLDQQGALTLVRLAGAPVGVLAAARRREVLAPLALFGGGSALLGVALGALTIGGLNLSADTRWMVLFAGLAVAGVAAVLGADLVSRPLLQRVTADLSQRD